MDFAQLNFVTLSLDNLGGDFAAETIENDCSIAALQSQHVAGVMRFRSAQDQSARIPFVRRNVKTMHSKIITADYADIAVVSII
jgi:hypothetical protein